MMARDFKIRSLLKLNFKNFFDMVFLREGLWTNIASGVLFNGQDPSLLMPDEDAPAELGLSYGQVYQSPFREWVHESGVPLDGVETQESPIEVSGVYVQGAFRAPNDPTFGHAVDYFNGRVIFNTPQINVGPIHANYAYRHVRVGFENNFNQQFREGYIEHQIGTNPETSRHLVYPSGMFQPFPAVFIETNGRSLKPYEMGNRSAILTQEVKFHIWSLDDLQRDDIMDIIDSQWRKTLPLVDFNMVPLPISGLYNTRTNEFIPYQHMLSNPVVVTTVGSGQAVKYLAFIDDSKPENVMYSDEYERGTVNYSVVIYLNRPNTVLPNATAPIHTVGNGFSF
jgi:hypothetical protein